MLQYPQIFRLRQHFPRPLVTDIAGEVHKQLAALMLQTRVRPGQTVAITAGSRGIHNIHTIIKATVDYFKSIDARPFIVTAMGSHGGGTAEGQRQLIEGYGITEAFCGCPIKASMETVVVCQTDEGFPVHFDKHAFEADHVLVCGRVKPHTDFVGDVESGLMKMMLIGLGKHAGAKIYHRAIHDYSFSQIVRSVGQRVLESCRIVAGLAIVENGYEETAQIVAVAPHELEEREKGLLIVARQLLPRLPFEQVHLLIVDEIGKNISGTGMDTNVIGRKFNDHAAVAGEKPEVRRIFVRGLSEATHGNASGLGIAEFCTTRAIQQMDVRTTRINCLTAGHVSAAMLPLDYATDREALDAALPTIGLVEPPDAKIVWIRNTLELSEILCSAPYLNEVRAQANLEVVGPLYDFPFDAAGNLPRFGI